MLKRIECDKFTQRIPNQEIVFHSGLNAVVGPDDGANSIGKSTFLQIVDFCFGGNTYGKGESDVIKNVGHHVIRFEFEFGGEVFRFARSTNDPTHIEQFEDNASKIVGLSDFQTFLKERYGVDTHLSLRSVISPFFRIYGKGNLSEKDPLESHPGARKDEAVKLLEALFGKEKDLEDARKRMEESKDRQKAFNQAKKFDFVYTSSIKDEEGLAEAKSQYTALENELNSAIDREDSESIEEEEMISQEDIETKSEYQSLRRKRHALEAKLRYMVGLSEEGRLMSEEDLAELKGFLPSLETKRIDEINTFQKAIIQNVNSEIEEEKRSLQEKISAISQKEKELEQTLASRHIPRSASAALLKGLQEKQRRADELERQIRAYERSKEVSDQCKEAEEEFAEAAKSKHEEIEKEINQSLETMNDALYNTSRYAPSISITRGGYSYSTYNDVGEGSSYKGILLLDLALLKLTSLPCAIHDSMLFNGIWKEPLEGIFSIYESLDKQVFIAIDKTNRLGEKTQKAIQDHKVLFLGPNESALFGRSWAEKSK